MKEHAGCIVEALTVTEKIKNLENIAQHFKFYFCLYGYMHV